MSKQIALLLLSVLAVCSHPTPHVLQLVNEMSTRGALAYEDVNQLEAFKEFIIEHNRVYTSEEEIALRFDLFIEDGKRKDYNFGSSEFSDRTPMEIRRRTGLVMTEDFKARILADKEKVDKFLESLKDVEIPEHFDWRDHEGVLGPIGDQGECGSCWAFAFTATLESNYAIRQKKRVVPLSKSQLVECIPINNDQDRCQGNTFSEPLNYANAKGFESEADYPYENGKGKVPKCHYDSSKLVFSLKNTTSLAFEDSETIQKFVATQGPVFAVINEDLIHQYNKDGKIIRKNRDTCDPSALGHCVVIVGYGIEGDLPYWIIRNSWGKKGPEKGYFKIERGTNACGIETFDFTTVFHEQGVLGN